MSELTKETQADQLRELEARLRVLELAVKDGLPDTPRSFHLPSRRFPICFLVTLGAAALAYRGLGPPNHPYQLALGALAIALAYHRRWLQWPQRAYEWVIAPVNALVVAVLFKLLIGSGIRHPLWWLLYPQLSLQRVPGKWLDVLPELKVLWQPFSLADWQLDLTLLQTFLLLVTLIGALFRFQPFVSFTAFFLIVISLPAFANFDWAWVFPAMTAGAIAIYLQTNPGYRPGFPGPV